MDENSVTVPDAVCSKKHGGFRNKTGKNLVPESGTDYFKVFFVSQLV